jgi:hypothetical protein
MPESSVHFHTFHGACPDCHKSSRCTLSRKVSIGCQKSLCSKAINSPLAASILSGSASQIQVSSVKRSRQLEDKTKKGNGGSPPTPKPAVEDYVPEVHYQDLTNWKPGQKIKRDELSEPESAPEDNYQNLVPLAEKRMKELGWDKL